MSEEYNILNSVKPEYFKTKFPYNLVDPSKILFTANKIKMIVSNLDSKNTERTGGHSASTTFYD